MTERMFTVVGCKCGKASTPRTLEGLTAWLLLHEDHGGYTIFAGREEAEPKALPPPPPNRRIKKGL